MKIRYLAVVFLPFVSSQSAVAKEPSNDRIKDCASELLHYSNTSKTLRENGFEISYEAIEKSFNASKKIAHIYIIRSNRLDSVQEVIDEIGDESERKTAGTVTAMELRGIKNGYELITKRMAECLEEMVPLISALEAEK